MRAKLNKYKFIILAVFLMTGVSISGWAITFHNNQTAKSTDSQKAPKNGSKSANIVSGAFNHSNPILLLVCSGLIGFIGVRRQGKKLESLEKVKQPERGSHENSLIKNNLERLRPRE